MISSSRWTALAVAFAGSLAAASAVAQTADAPPAVDVPPLNCTSPGSMPLERQGAEMGRFQKRLDDYKTCVNQYTKSTGAKANELAAQSRAYADAANKAIDDYNVYVTGLNEAAKAKAAGK